ncbi:MAG TPA: methyltransferase domain-containing protein, partial [Anaerolineae bacterium]|nr:methyltransferase domain-containing protein [Anaerolineae bacterium]
VRFSKSAEGPLGFQAARRYALRALPHVSNRVAPIEVCHIVEPPILEWLQSNETTNLQINSIDDQVDVRLSNLQLPTSKFQFHVSPDSFFQVNSSLINTLVEQMLTKLDPKKHQVILDAYCGVGLFTCFIAPKADQVIGIESSRSAIRDAKQNLSEFKNVKLLRGLVEKILPTITGPIDGVVVDPPRAGCGRTVIQALIDHRVQRIVYVSCDPSTLARDARQLIDGGYQLIEVQPIDLFPQTFHIETVALFVHIGK